MHPDAFVGTIVLCGLVMPAIVWPILRRWGRLSPVTGPMWLTIYGLSALACIAVLPRKHIESALITNVPRSFWVYNLAQVDNEFWEQTGKLAAMLIALWLFGKPLRVLFSSARSAVAMGYWSGLSYGFGEALILAILFAVPAWAPLFGLNTFTPYMVGWPYVYERLWAMHAHAIMGALVGLGLHNLLARHSRLGLVSFFALAMLYHHLVDGTIITAAFVPALAQMIGKAGMLFVPLLVAIGFVVLTLAYHGQHSFANKQ